MHFYLFCMYIFTYSYTHIHSHICITMCMWICVYWFFRVHIPYQSKTKINTPHIFTYKLIDLLHLMDILKFLSLKRKKPKLMVSSFNPQLSNTRCSRIISDVSLLIPRLWERCFKIFFLWFFILHTTIVWIFVSCYRQSNAVKYSLIRTFFFYRERKKRKSKMKRIRYCKQRSHPKQNDIDHCRK